MAVKSVEEKDELMLAVQIDLDRAVTKEVCDAVYETASFPLQEKTEQKLETECKTRKTVIMDVISNSVSLERLYFIIRSSIMGAIAGVFSFTFISILQVTNFLALILIGLLGFVISLLASRVLDKSVVRVSNMAILYLKRHQKARDFILKRF